VFVIRCIAPVVQEKNRQNKYGNTVPFEWLLFADLKVCCRYKL